MNMNMNTYRIVITPYERYGEAHSEECRFECPSDKLAVLYADPNFGFNSLEIDEECTKEEVKELLSHSLEDLIVSLENRNGDGCDFVEYLENETTGEILVGEHNRDISATMTWEYGDTEEEFLKNFED